MLYTFFLSFDFVCNNITTDLSKKQFLMNNEIISSYLILNL
jgi:hypothetical protein